ncbi:DDB1- and CUL4-associated factor 13 [Dictyocoela muelleri]|nr:DDB1- and CUL4-associated factor 13 [Dictyocoela muelleri]
MFIPTIKRDNDEKGPSYQFIKDTRHHPFLIQREYIRALNAAKIERMLSKPFVKAFDNHKSGVIDLIVGQNKIASLSHSEAFLQNIEKKFIQENDSSESFNHESDLIVIPEVNSIALRNDELIYSKKNQIFFKKSVLVESNSKIKKMICENTLEDNLFALNRNEIIIYDINKYNPSVMRKISGKFDGFSVSEHLIGAFNRKIILFDIKSNEKIISFESGLKTNELKIYDNFIVTANEDYNAYLYDMRYLKKFITLRGHINSVLSVDIKKDQIVTGSYDKTIRLFRNPINTNFNSFNNSFKSRDIYHSRRMEAVNKVVIKDNFIFSASDDGSIRMWRLFASQKEVASGKEKRAFEYSKQVKSKFSSFKDVKRIDNHRFLPKNMKGLIKTHNEMIGAKIRKEKKARNQFD